MQLRRGFFPFPLTALVLAVGIAGPSAALTTVTIAGSGVIDELLEPEALLGVGESYDFEITFDVDGFDFSNLSGTLNAGGTLVAIDGTVRRGAGGSGIGGARFRFGSATPPVVDELNFAGITLIVGPLLGGTDEELFSAADAAVIQADVDASRAFPPPGGSFSAGSRDLDPTATISIGMGAPPIPEPSSYGMFALGVLVVAGSRGLRRLPARTRAVACGRPSRSPTA